MILKSRFKIGETHVIKEGYMADDVQADGYYGDDGLDNEELDLSFLDEKEDDKK
jgi:hypothetical protein